MDADSNRKGMSKLIISSRYTTCFSEFPQSGLISCYNSFLLATLHQVWHSLGYRVMSILKSIK